MTAASTTEAPSQSETVPPNGSKPFQRSNTHCSTGSRDNKSLLRSQTASSVDHSSRRRGDEMGNDSKRMDKSQLSQSVRSQTLTGDLDDIVNSVARRAVRRKPRTEQAPSPTRRNRAYSPGAEDKQVRVPRSQRQSDLDASTQSAPPLGRVEDEEGIEDSTMGGSVGRRPSTRRSNNALKRMSTVDSRNRFIKMLEAKTLTSFRTLNQRKVENNKPQTYMSRLFVTFRDCLEQLGADDVSDRKLEAMAVLIHECMSGDSRNYHSVQHVFEISKDFSENPIAVLAAMFHDCIYYNVDGALSPMQEEVLHGCFQLSDAASGNSNASTSHTGMTCRAHMKCQTDTALCMVETIFGFEHGEEITGQKGLNEFLSAVVAVRQLHSHLNLAQCAKIAGCIAATIPFKNKPVEGKKTYMEQLFDNMVKTNDYFELGMPEEEIVETVQIAAQVANADIGNFGSDDIYYFLDNTWSLLTETNTTLRRSFLFTVIEFQHSLFKMNGFFHFLDPAAIFASFQNVPDSKEITKLTDQARKNLEMGQKYVGAKLLSASVLAAFATLTGGDAPLSLFVGDLPSRHHQSQSINDALPQAGDKPLFHSDGDDQQDHLDLVVYQILSGGRRSETSFDVKQSPLGAFLYAVVGDRGLSMILENRNIYPMTENDAVELLSCLPREVVRYLAKTIATVAISRADAIMEVVDNLPVKCRSSEDKFRSEPPDTVTIDEGGESE